MRSPLAGVRSGVAMARAKARASPTCPLSCDARAVGFPSRTTLRKSLTKAVCPRPSTWISSFSVRAWPALAEVTAASEPPG